MIRHALARTATTLAPAALLLASLGACSSTSDGAGTATTSGAAGSATSATAKATGTTAVTTPATLPKGGDVVLTVIDTTFGKAIGIEGGGVDRRVVYTWNDEADAGAITCTDAACLEKWPPVYAAAVTGDAAVTAKLSVVTRPDGSTQAAVDGKALYLMALDAPGQANCQGAEGWWIVNPDGSQNTTV